MFCKKGVFRNFTKSTGNHLCQSLFFNKVADLRPATLLRKRRWHRCFPGNFTKFLRTCFLKEHPWWVLLKRHYKKHEKFESVDCVGGKFGWTVGVITKFTSSQSKAIPAKHIRSCLVYFIATFPKIFS